MLLTIPLISCLSFGVCYPLFLCLCAKDPIKHNFHRFQLACPVIVAGLAIVALLLQPSIPDALKISLLGWLIAALAITGLSWNKEFPNTVGIVLISVAGILIVAPVHQLLVGPGIFSLVAGLLSGFLLTSAFYAMNLGHFYLNVHGLNVNHFKIATIAFTVILACRLFWNILYLVNGTLIYQGEEISVWSFSMRMDGFLIWVAVFFGTIMPLGASYFAFGTLKLRNTQATTGIVYVLVSAVLLGDLAYKYFWLKYSIYM